MSQNAEDVGGAAQLRFGAVSFETHTGNSACIDTENSEWFDYSIENHAQFHDRPGYRDGFIEITFTIEKWDNQGHTVIDMEPEELRTFIEELAGTIDCEVVDRD